MKRLLLLGGGHAHVGVLNALARQPLADVETVLVTPYRRQIYSGMLPGWIAGHYPLDACVIPLEALAQRCGCRFLQTAGIGINPGARQLLCADGSGLDYDALSIDIGSTTGLASITDTVRHALPVRPIEAFISAWERLVEQAGADGEASLAIIGGGAAGVELALAMQYRLKQVVPGGRLALHLVSSSQTLLPGHAAGVGKRLLRIVRERQIGLRLGLKATAVTAAGVELSNGETIPCRRAILAIDASAPSWLRETGIALDSSGFIAVDECLRSVSHPDIFAVGDIASMVGHPYPKSGVYAVSSGPPLALNLRRALTNLPLLPYRPQRWALYLISTADSHAIMSWGPFSCEGDWVWRWKDHIDRHFVTRYRLD